MSSETLQGHIPHMQAHRGSPERTHAGDLVRGPEHPRTPPPPSCKCFLCKCTPVPSSGVRIVAFHVLLDRANEDTLFGQAALAINGTSYRGPGLSILPVLCEALV